MDQDKFNSMFEIAMAAYVAKAASLGINEALAPDDYKEAIALGVTDGTRPQALATRQEAAVLAYRAAKDK